MTNQDLAIKEYITTYNSIKEICKKYCVSDRCIYQAIAKYPAIRRHHDSTSYLSFFLDKELFYYTLGLVASDGYLYEPKHCIEISLHVRDVQLLRDLSLRIYGCDRVIIDQTSQDRARLIVKDKDTYQVFKSYGLFQHKSALLDMPLDMIPQPYFHHFLRGYIDGDGHYSYHNLNKVHMSIVGNEMMMRKIQHFVQLYYGCKSNVYRITTLASFQMTRWTIQHTPTTKRLLQILYRDATIFMERKHTIIKSTLSAV